MSEDKNISMEKFTFGVITYNQEKVVSETLNSILYQVKKYGHGIKCSLFIIEDCSTDNTRDVIKQWISKNSEYYITVRIIYNEKNEGIVYSYCKMLEEITDLYFKIVAGDDLISSGNIFNHYEAMNECTIRTFLPMIIRDGKIIVEENRLIRHYYNMKNYKRQKVLKRFKKGNYFNTPSTIFTKKLFEISKSQELLSEFTTFEDNPTWYSMLKNCSEVDVDFRYDTIVLYRINGNSISHSSHRNYAFESDLIKLWGIYKKDSSGFERMFWRMQLFFGFLPSKYRPLNIYKKVNEIVWRIISMFDNDYQKFRMMIYDKIKKEQDFYDFIKL